MVRTGVSERDGIFHQFQCFFFIRFTADPGAVAYTETHDRRVKAGLRSFFVVLKRLFLIHLDAHAVFVGKARFDLRRRKALICGLLKILEGSLIVFLCFGSPLSVVEGDPVHRLCDALVRGLLDELESLLLILFTAQAHLEHHAEVISSEWKFVFMGFLKKFDRFGIIFFAADAVTDGFTENITSDPRRQLSGLFEKLQCFFMVSFDPVSAGIFLSHADHGDRVFLVRCARKPHGGFLRVSVDIRSRVEHLRKRKPRVHIAACGRFSIPFIGLLQILFHTGSGLITAPEIKTGKRMACFRRFPEHGKRLVVDRLHSFLAVKSSSRLCIRIVKHVCADCVFDLIVKVSFLIVHGFIFSQNTEVVAVSAGGKTTSGQSSENFF